MLWRLAETDWRASTLEIGLNEARMKRPDRKTRARIDRLCAEGNALCDAQDYAAAGRKFEAALALFPSPAVQCGEPAMYVYAALLCGGHDNPFVNLRMGQVELELGHRKQAAEYLARAYMGGGREVFEAEAPKYFALVEKVLRPPLP